MARRPDPCVADMSTVSSSVQCRPRESPNRPRTEAFDEVPNREPDSDDRSNGSTARRLTVVAPPSSDSIASNTDTTVPVPATGRRGDAKGADRRRLRKGIRGGLSAVTVAVVAFFVVTKRATLTSSIGRLGHPHWSWIPVALVLEAVSMATFASMQSLLLRAGGTRDRPSADDGHHLRGERTRGVGARGRTRTGDGFHLPTLHEARCRHVPGQLGSPRRRPRLVGRGDPGPRGGRCTLRQRARGGVGHRRRPRGCGRRSARCAPPSDDRSCRSRPGATNDMDGPAHRTSDVRIRSTIPAKPSGAGSRVWNRSACLHRSGARSADMGLTNWLADAGVLAISLLAIGAPVPWRTLLLVYGLATVVGSLGITPGGIGLVEGHPLRRPGEYRRPRRLWHWPRSCSTAS